MEYHPDRNNGDKEKETLFKEVNEAYATLSDAQKKASYDRYGTSDMGGGFNGGQGGFHTNMDFSDIFESFFGGGFQGGGTRRRSVGVE